MIGEPMCPLSRRSGAHAACGALAAKLGLSIDPAAEKPIREMAVLLENVPPARLFDECSSCLTSGPRGEVSHPIARCRPASRPAAAARRDSRAADGRTFVMLALANTDQRVRPAGRSRPFLFATLLWHEVLAQWERIQTAGERAIPALFAAMDEVLDSQAENSRSRAASPATSKDIWRCNRAERAPASAPMRCWNSSASAPATISLLRAESGEVPQELRRLVALLHRCRRRGPRNADAGDRRQEETPASAQAGGDKPAAAGAQVRRRGARRQSGRSAGKFSDAIWWRWRIPDCNGWSPLHRSTGQRRSGWPQPGFHQRRRRDRRRRYRPGRLLDALFSIERRAGRVATRNGPRTSISTCCSMVTTNRHAPSAPAASATASTRASSSCRWPRSRPPAGFPDAARSLPAPATANRSRS